MRKYSIERIQKYKIKHNGKNKRVCREFQKLNQLEIVYLEYFLDKYYNGFSLKDLIEKMERICSLILSNGHLLPQVSDECIEEKISRHFTEKKYDIILAIDERDVEGYGTDITLNKIKRAGGKKRRHRSDERES